MEFSHINDKGFAKMVDISSKADTARKAVAEGKISTTEEVIEAVKGNLLAQLNNIDVEEKDGTVVNIGEKYGKKIGN